MSREGNLDFFQGIRWHGVMLNQASSGSTLQKKERKYLMLSVLSGHGHANINLIFFPHGKGPVMTPLLFSGGGSACIRKIVRVSVSPDFCENQKNGNCNR